MPDRIPLINRVPQCIDCIHATHHRGYPATYECPAEPGGVSCGIKDDFIPSGQEPLEGECDLLTGYASAPPHALDVALAQRDWASAAEWLTENVPAEALRLARPGMPAEAIYNWNEFHPRADGRVEN